jgi:hypothetical protein
VETIVVQIEDDELANAIPVGRKGLEPELPQEMVVEGLRPGEHALHELAFGVAIPFFAGDKARIGGFLKVTLLLALGRGFRGNFVIRVGGPVLGHFQGRVFLDFLADGGTQFLDREGHDPDRLKQLGTELEFLYLPEFMFLKLHSFLVSPQFSIIRGAFSSLFGDPLPRRRGWPPVSAC